MLRPETKPPRVRWLQASGHAGSLTERAIEGALSLEPDICTLSEGYRNRTAIRSVARREGYRVFEGHPDRVDRRGRVVNHDVIVLTRRATLVVDDEHEFWVDAEIPWNLKYMPERHGKTELLHLHNHPDVQIGLVAWHPQPNPLRPGRPGIRAHYRRSVDRAERQIRILAADRPSLLLAGGDLQLGASRSDLAPNMLASRLRMHAVHHGIDWQLWRGADWAKAGARVIDPARWNAGLDHEWMLLDLEQRTKEAH